jgi:DNA polymerase III sliding clamp (beta) subunit (PCNA family)
VLHGTRAEVPARVFKYLTDDEALRISFSENLARKDLTLWEIANYCRMIAEEQTSLGKSQGEIEVHLAGILRKEERTVRRYLAVSSIQNENIRRELHSGSMTLSIGDVFTRQGLTEKGRAALYRLYKRFRNPPPFDPFDELVKNALELSKWSRLKVEKILSMKKAPDFLTISPDELKERAEYLMKITNKPLAQILAHEIGDLKSPIAKVMSKNELAPFVEKFSQKASAISTRISDTLKSKKKSGEVVISPVGVLKDKTIKLTITAPVPDVQKVVQFTLDELKGEIASLENLFKKPPKPSPRKEEIRAKKRVIVDKNAAIAFTIRLEKLRDVLKSLAKDGSFPTNEEDSKGQILMRAASENEVEFGRYCNNGLLIPSEARILQKGASALLLRPIYTPIIKLAAKNDTVCDIQVVPVRGKSSPDESTFSLKLQDMTYKWNVPSFAPDELSKLLDKKRNADTTVEMEASDLKDMLGKALVCIKSDEVRIALTGIFFVINEKHLRLTGTNGIKLFEVTKPHSGISGSAKQVIVPFHTGTLLRALLKKDTGVVRTGVSEEAVSFEFNGVSLIGKPIRGYLYPDYSAIFEKAESSFSIPIRNLREIASNLSIVSDPEDNHRLTLRAEKNRISFGNGKGSTEYSANHASGVIDIDVNARFLLDLARSMDGEEVEMKICATEKGSKILTFHPDDGRQGAFLVGVIRREPEKTKENATENRSNSKAE